MSRRHFIVAKDCLKLNRQNLSEDYGSTLGFLDEAWNGK
jgi:hypothetical protein